MLQTHYGRYVVDKILINLIGMMVDSPEEIKVQEANFGDKIVYGIAVSKADIGKLIGKNGRNIDAVRTLFNAFSGKTGVKYSVEVID